MAELISSSTLSSFLLQEGFTPACTIMLHAPEPWQFQPTIPAQSENSTHLCYDNSRANK